MIEGPDAPVHRRIAIAVCLGLAFADCTAPSERPDPTDVLRSAILALGWSEIESPSSFISFASGSLDKAAEGQGRSPSIPSPGPYTETLAIAPAGQAVAWDYHEERYDGTEERYGESYPSDALRYHLVHGFGVAVPVAAASFEDDRRRLRRRFLPLLVAELLADSLRLIGDVADDGTLRVDGRLEDRTPVSLRIASDTWLPTQVSYSATLPGKGPVTVHWTYGDYRNVTGGGRLPFAYSSRVDSLAYTAMTVDSVRPGGNELFEPPGHLEILDPRPFAEAADGAVPEVRSIGDGLFVVPGVRSGFSPLVVEFEDFLVVVDAPASFPLLGTIPAAETDAGPHISWASERLVDAVSLAWPEKPIEYAILTHHHEDHVGGVRALVAAGATILASEQAIAVARRLVELSPDGIGDRLATRPVELETEVIRDVRSISDGDRTIEILPVGDNPHAEGMLVVSLLEANALYVSDLVTPAELGSYPAASHAALDRFFAGWLLRSGLDPDSIWSMHSDVPATRSHLERLSR